MSKSKRQEYFVNGHCCCDCPNFEIQTADERYGYGIAEDMGLEEVECRDCHYNRGSGARNGKTSGRNADN